MDRLYFATSNKGKLRDFAIAAELFARERGAGAVAGMESLPDLESMAAPDEDGESFEENAILKAVYYSLFAPGLTVVADDSGLSVEALNGAPGVYSARYAARAGGAAAGLDTDQSNNAHLLAELARTLGRQAADLALRTADYHCFLAAARDGKILATGAGSVSGQILLSPRGVGGFGYDPVFYLPELNRTMAELDGPTRFGLSHRGRALEQLLLHFSAGEAQS